MTHEIGTSAFILAAGLGTRMRPLTDDRPKPLIEVGGKPLIDYAIDAVRGAKVSRVVVNAHYLADKIESWARTVEGFNISVSDERNRLLDTGGGILKALPQLGPHPFFVLNGDGMWMETETPALQRLRQHWNDETMDCLLLLCPLAHAKGFDGAGDFHVGADGSLARRSNMDLPLYIYIGAYLVHPRLFAGVTEDVFSMNRLWDKAIAAARLHGLVHNGVWLHVGTPEAVSMAEMHLRNN
jgi:N-acetyl-alpha-D-muramate 1-phosphate uridylyltransferase